MMLGISTRGYARGERMRGAAYRIPQRVFFVLFAMLATELHAQASPFSAHQIAKGVYLIDEGGKVNMYLVLGKERAALIDTGNGEAGLAAFVSTLTSLPVVVINTHGHSDHASGNRYFAVAYIHAEDLAMAQRSGGSRKTSYLQIAEGDSIDLGGRRLVVIGVPGHTAGSVCLLEPDARILFSGDHCNNHVWLFLYESLSVEEYRASLVKLIARSAEFDLILPGHGSPTDASRLRALDATACGILAGESGSSYPGHAPVLCYGPNDALIAYLPTKLRAPKR